MPIKKVKLSDAKGRFIILQNDGRGYNTIGSVRGVIKPAFQMAVDDDYFCKYYDSIYVLFKTGMRISEFTGLTISDVDLKNKKIIVNHQLQRKSNMQ